MGSTRIIEQCQVAPSPGAPAELLLKLLHFDIVSLPVGPMRFIIFYELQCSETNFFNTIVPNFKTSLSLSLKHFAPLAGKILIPHVNNTTDHNNNNNNNRMPVSRYVDWEDSVPLSIAISNADFEYLTANHSIHNNELQDLVPQRLPTPGLSPDSSTVKVPLTAFQVTVFPNKGICIGLAGHHAICDAITLHGFFRAWASINRSNGEGSPDLLECLPSYDRVNIAHADRMAVELWDSIKVFPSVTTTSLTATDAGVRGTFVLNEAGIKTLERRAFQYKRRDGVRFSSYVLACAHLWTCLVRSATAAGEQVDDDEPEYIVCPINCRGRLNPPLPDTYFGNCITFAIAESTHGKLKGRDGFSSAAEAIDEAIQRTISNDKGIMDGSMKTLLEFLGLVGKRGIIISGSPRLDFYGIDYGWGRPLKVDCFLDEHTGLVFVCKSREYGGEMEITVLMSKAKMEVFAPLFNQGLPTEKLCSKM